MSHLFLKFPKPVSYDASNRQKKGQARKKGQATTTISKSITSECSPKIHPPKTCLAACHLLGFRKP
jgi:hypothetical protein